MVRIVPWEVEHGARIARTFIAEILEGGEVVRCIWDLQSLLLILMWMNKDGG